MLDFIPAFLISQFLFTGGEDGSVCFRFTGGTLDEISGQLSIFSADTRAGFTILSRPVGTLKGE